ncbi:hypothetical protein P9027_29630 [Bacillus thuringiensis]|uniref:hypothetical protein n=1 Tax=Bacillus thuringiensis TaxID=1428 RepID=UPI002DB7DB9F|nr:hypothetical protein [Bacillus thuringiensis]MEC3226081.1 hypothetical protein [Bacillus thuringiensis]MEC3462862.1 hypothetical protein [Bacillus thuringiensis]MEC3556024.1 hypothetical protein [Bacillus thuringiensis]MED2058847.1 hypothetical protein [Bacillus thuringiensis]
MRSLSVIVLVLATLVFLNVISLHTIGTLSLAFGFLLLIGIGVYFLYHIVFNLAALFTTVVGAIMVISLITYAAAHLI